mmetsp:Transcript_23409/g.48582  ORF Transcript_23409/g.48582 Transcript_23409/m.48582 type:complete len:177 (+) Transcript_23409:102-632(+)
MCHINMPRLVNLLHNLLHIRSPWGTRILLRQSKNPFQNTPEDANRESARYIRFGAPRRKYAFYSDILFRHTYIPTCNLGDFSFLLFRHERVNAQAPFIIREEKISSSVQSRMRAMPFTVTFTVTFTHARVPVLECAGQHVILSIPGEMSVIKEDASLKRLCVDGRDGNDDILQRIV